MTDIEKRMHRAFIEKRKHAKQGKIPFDLTEEEFREKWRGFEHLMGCKKGSYQLGRINEDRTNGKYFGYSVDNCRVISQDQNLAEQHNIPGMKEKMGRFFREVGKARAKPIIATNKSDPTDIREFPSALEAARILGVERANVSAAARGNIKSAYGFFWKYSSKK